jgi:hypothetical protein
MVEPSRTQPQYEVIKKEDLEGAYRDALRLALAEALANIQALIEIYSSIQPSSLWTWGYTSRWDYDMWW